MQFLQSFRSLALILVIAVAAYACSGGSGDAGSEPKNPSAPAQPSDDGSSGEGDSSTVEGVDADSDGIRDDVQQFIEQYPVTSDYQRVALMRRAILDQSLMENASDSEKIKELALAIEREVKCVKRSFSSEREKMEYFSGYMNNLLNTRERLEAYKLAQRKLSVVPPIWDYEIPECE